MDHIVSLDPAAHEIEDLLKGTKSMIIHGADKKCNPYGIVKKEDVLYFVEKDSDELVKAKAVVSSVYNSYTLSVPESYELIIRNQDKLVLPDDFFYRYAGKKYIVLIGLRDIEQVDPLSLVRSDLSYANHWEPVNSSSITSK